MTVMGEGLTEYTRLSDMVCMGSQKRSITELVFRCCCLRPARLRSLCAVQARKTRQVRGGWRSVHRTPAWHAMIEAGLSLKISVRATDGCALHMGRSGSCGGAPVLSRASKGGGEA